MHLYLMLMLIILFVVAVAYFAKAAVLDFEQRADNDVMSVKAALENAGVPVKGAELVMEPTTPVAVTIEDAKKVLRLVDRLEESDDVQSVYHTMELTDEIAAALEE